MDKLHYRLIFDPVKGNEISRTNPLKVVKFKNLLENVVMCGKYSLTMFANFLCYRITRGNCYHFRLKNGNNLRTLYKNMENSRISHGYIFRILQDFATKVWNFTTFERLFPGISFLFVWICLDQKLVYNDLLVILIPFCNRLKFRSLGWKCPCNRAVTVLWFIVRLNWRITCASHYLTKFA